MTAISKSWVVIADGAVDPDSPIDTTLMTGIRDDLVHMREWLGASYTAGAVQDHNHDGANSALVEVGGNLLRNGSFESGTTGWTLTDYTGGSSAVQTSGAMHGAYCLALTSTVLANGGAYADSNEYIPITPGRYFFGQMMINASAANISAKHEVRWFDSGKALISATTTYTTTNAPTSATNADLVAEAPSSAAFYQIRLTGGIPASGSATGTVYFDGINSTYARLFSPALIGAPTAPTQAVGTNNTTIATTAFCEAGFVNNDLGVGAIGSILTLIKTASGTLASGATIAGSSLQTVAYQNGATGDYFASGVALSGTWRFLSSADHPTITASTCIGPFQRIS